MAIGFFDAGLLGAVCISLASSWAFGEVFGWAHSLNHKIKEAPWFYAYYFFDLLLAGTVVLIPGAPLGLITLFVQVIATTLMPAALVFLILLLNDRKLMGKHVNSWWENTANISIVVAVIITSTLYGISAVFPDFFKDPAAGCHDLALNIQNLPQTLAGLGAARLAMRVGLPVAALAALALVVLRRKQIYRLVGYMVGALDAMPVGRAGQRIAAWVRGTRPGEFIHLTAEQVRGVNRRYATPEMKTTRFARVCLVSLRVYLFSLIALMIIKFVIAANAGTVLADVTPPAATQPAATQPAVPDALPNQ
jgi:hypothetical protein